MSWQRIDENSYIDDTLVTCAEYQLFIDEMREQGKYYQPDHWTSYQFPKGNARGPILGMRPSDASVFCDWLTFYEKKKWKYRLPNIQEGNTFPVTTIIKSHLGYWIIEGDRQIQFVWIGSTPEDARLINLQVASIINIELVPPLSLERIPIRALDLDRTLAISGSLNNDLRHTPDRSSNAKDWDIYGHTPERERAHNLARNMAHTLNRDHVYDHDRIFAHTLELARALAYTQARALDIYLDIITLQERIAGRSPAFEGIRLVKERVR